MRCRAVNADGAAALHRALFFPDTATIRTSLDSRGVFGRYHVTVRLRAALVVAGIA
jgi:hypothetical protein